MNLISSLDQFCNKILHTLDDLTVLQMMIFVVLVTTID